MAAATITSKGQTTIPKEIRSYLHLEVGDQVEFIIEEDGRVFLLPATVDISELAGLLPPPKKKISLEQIEQTIRKRHSK